MTPESRETREIDERGPEPSAWRFPKRGGGWAYRTTHNSVPGIEPLYTLAAAREGYVRAEDAQARIDRLQQRIDALEGVAWDSSR